MSKTLKLLILAATIILIFALVGHDSYAFRGFQDSTEEPCFMSDPFCAGEDGSGAVTNCKGCKDAGNSEVCDFDSSSNAADCHTDIDSAGNLSCTPGTVRCR